MADQMQIRWFCMREHDRHRGRRALFREDPRSLAARG
jgi:hypothetical protein